MNERMSLHFRVLEEGESDEFKYELSGNHQFTLATPFEDIDSYWIAIRGGELCIKDKYWWDGPSGPAIDTPNWLWASLVHDALYQAMKTGLIPFTRKHRRWADSEMRRILEDQGMPKFRRWYSWAAVRAFGGGRIRRALRKRRREERES